jgi:hypothetical protein
MSGMQIEAAQWHDLWRTSPSLDLSVRGPRFPVAIDEMMERCLVAERLGVSPLPQAEVWTADQERLLARLIQTPELCQTRGKNSPRPSATGFLLSKRGNGDFVLPCCILCLSEQPEIPA